MGAARMVYYGCCRNGFSATHLFRMVCSTVRIRRWAAYITWIRDQASVSFCSNHVVCCRIRLSRHGPRGKRVARHYLSLYGYCLAHFWRRTIQLGSLDQSRNPERLEGLSKLGKFEVSPLGGMAGIPARAGTTNMGFEMRSNALN